MASQTVTLELTVSQAKAVANLLAVNDAIKKMDGTLKGTMDNAAQSGKKTAGGFNAIHSSIDRAVKAFLSLNMGMRAFHQAIAIIRAELEKIKEYRTMAADKGAEVGQYMGRIKKIMPYKNVEQMKGLGADPEMTIFQMALEESTRTGIPMTKLLAAVETAISGGTSATILERVKTGFALAPALSEWDPEDLKVAGQATQMAREAFGVGAKETIAGITQATGVSNLTSQGKVSQNIISSATQLSTMGYGWEEALESIVGAQVATKDMHGRMSATMHLANLSMTYERFGESMKLKGRDIEDFMRAQGRFGKGTQYHEQAMAWNKQIMGGELDDDVLKRMAKASDVPLEEMQGEISALMGRARLKPAYKAFMAHKPTKIMGDLIKDIAANITDPKTAVEEFEEKNKWTLATLGWKLGEATKAQEESQLMSDPAAQVLGWAHKYLSGPHMARLGKLGGSVVDPLEQFKLSLSETGSVEEAMMEFVKILEKDRKRAMTVQGATRGMVVGSTGSMASGYYAGTPRMRTKEEMLEEGDMAAYNRVVALENGIQVFSAKATELGELQRKHIQTLLEREQGKAEEPPVATNQAAVPDVVPQAE